MQVSSSGVVALTQLPTFAYFEIYEASCLIGEKGCLYLSRGRWNKLQELWMCKWVLIQGTIMLEIEDVGT